MFGTVTIAMSYLQFTDIEAIIFAFHEIIVNDWTLDIIIVMSDDGK